MDLSQLTSTDGKEITKLLEEKESLLAQVSEIDSQLDAFTTGSTPAPKRAAAPAPAKKKAPAASSAPRRRKAAAPAPARGRRGALKEAMIKSLKSAGSDGISVKDLAKKLNQKPANIHAWFHSTGKKMDEVQKVGPATYGWIE